MGKLKSVHGVSPVFLQRASIVVIMSFVFFLGTLIVFSSSQQIAYFLLSTAFMVVCLFTLGGLWLQKRNVVKVYENGIAYRGATIYWDGIASVNSQKSGLRITGVDGESMIITNSLHGFAEITRHVRAKLSNAK